MYKKTENRTITELTRIQILLAKKLYKKDYDKVMTVMWALLNGADYGVEEVWSTKFLRTAEDIYFFHKNKQEETNNVVKLKVIQGGKNDESNR